MPEIRPLSGLRFLAALGVVGALTWVAHRAQLREHFPNHVEWANAVLRQEHFAAGLFFCLSGYVLTHRYLGALTPDLAEKGPQVRRFLLARLARIWPAYLVVLHLTVALLVARSALNDTTARPEIDTLAYLRQALLVHVWSEPDHVFTSWLPIGWALSALVAASLAFPVLAVLVERVGRVTEPSARVVMALLLPLPVLVVLTAAPRSSDDYLWLLLVFSYFSAGMFLASAVSGASHRSHRRWSVLLTALTAALVATTVWVTLSIQVSSRGLIAMTVVPLVCVAASSTGPVARVLGSRPLVAGGRVAYAFMLVHAPVLAVHDALVPNHLGPDDVWPAVTSMAGSALVSLVAAVALHRWLEAPTRASVVRDAGAATGSQTATPPRSEVGS